MDYLVVVGLIAFAAFGGVLWFFTKDAASGFGAVQPVDLDSFEAVLDFERVAPEADDPYRSAEVLAGTHRGLAVRIAGIETVRHEGSGKNRRAVRYEIPVVQMKISGAEGLVVGRAGEFPAGEVFGLEESYREYDLVPAADGLRCFANPPLPEVVEDRDFVDRVERVARAYHYVRIAHGWVSLAPIDVDMVETDLDFVTEFEPWCDPSK